MSQTGKDMSARLSQFAAALAVLSAFSPQAAWAQDSEEFKRWAVSLNATRVFVDEDAPDITLAGGPVPGSNVRIGDATSATVDIGYFFTPNIAADLFLGVPATAEIDGAGSLEPLGTLAKVNYGPVILSAQYHFNNLGKVHPYLGVGVGRIVFLNERDRALANFSIDDSWAPALGTLAKVNYGPVILSAQYHFNNLGRVHPYLGVGVGRIVFLNERDRALANFSIDDSWAPAAQVGVRYELDTAWMLNADVRYVPFSTHATGSLGGAPVRTSLDIDPILANVGVTYRF